MTMPASAEPLPAPSPHLVLTVEEAAAAHAIGRTLMYALIRDRAVETVRIGRLRRVPTDALAEYVARLRAEVEA